MLDSFKQLVPLAVRRATRDAWRAGQWRRAMHALQRLPPGVAPSRGLLESLRKGWGNEGYSADIAFLEEVAGHAAATSGPVLECGSGLTTLLLGVIAGGRGVEVWTLEHDPAWYAKTAAALRRDRVPGVRLCFAPLRDYGDCQWYDTSLHELPDTYRLVVCDGPPASTPGGRYGLLPVLRHALGGDAVVLLDDAERPSEVQVIERWRHERPIRVRRHHPAEGPFAVITFDA